MGLFGKLFEKKICSVCGGEIGLLGNRKLEDGNLCKSCAAKLSPWFSERRSSTVSDIINQLAYRVTNETEAIQFNTTRQFGDGSKQLLFDEAARKFTIVRKNGLKEDNPDIVDISAITSFECVPEEHKREATYKDKEGNTQHFTPPRYEYSYDFDYEILVNHPFFEKMYLQLNSRTVELPGNMLPAAKTTFLSLMTSTSAASNPCPEYDRYRKMGEEITELINSLRTAPAEPSAAGAEAAKETVPGAEAWTCPYCGTVNTGASCTGCGADKA